MDGDEEQLGEILLETHLLSLGKASKLRCSAWLLVSPVLAALGCFKWLCPALFVQGLGCAVLLGEVPACLVVALTSPSLLAKVSFLVVMRIKQ